MTTEKTWVLVANGAKARIFNFANHSLKELMVLTHPESRMHEHDLVSDRPGATNSAAGFGRHGMQPHTEPQKNEVEHFAKEVSHYLNLEHNRNHFQHLHVIAAPAFLGLLRHNLKKETQHIILKEINKDVVDASLSDLLDYLPKL